MKAKILFLLIVSFFALALKAQNIDSNILYGKRIEQIEQNLSEYKIELQKVNEVAEKSSRENDNLGDMAGNIIEWTSLVFTIFSTLLVVASIYTGFQIWDLRKTKKELILFKEQTERESKKLVSELQELKEQFAKENEKSLQLIYPLIEGQWHFYQGDYHKALTAFKEARQIEPNHPKIVRNYYRILSNLGKADEVIPELEKLSNEFPNDSAIKYRLAQAYRRNNQLSNAENVIKDIAIISREPDALYEYGTILLNLKRFDEAENMLIQASRRFIELEEGVKYWVDINLAVCQLVLNKKDEGENIAKRVINNVEALIRKAPNNPQYLANLGLAKILIGQIDSGAIDLRKSLNEELPIEIAKSILSNWT